MEVVTLPVHSTAGEEFRRLARFVPVPRPEDAADLTFTPAFGRFEIGRGPVVDISHLLIPASPDPLGEARHRPVIDRHLDSEEVWLVTRGELVMGMGESAVGGDSVPSVHDLRLFLLREGDMIVLPRGRWHGGIWGARPDEPAEFLMFLSGHRADADGSLVDHIMESYAEDVAVRPSASLP